MYFRENKDYFCYVIRLLYSYFTAQVSQYDLYDLSFCCKYRVAVGETNPGGGSIHQRETILMFMTPACSDLQASSPSKDKLDCSQFSSCVWDLQCIMVCYEVCSNLKYHWENTVKKKPPRKKNAICIVVFCVVAPHTAVQCTNISEKHTTPIYRVASRWRQILLQNAGMHLLD